MTPTQAMSQRLLFPQLLLESPHHFAVQSLTRRSTGLPIYGGQLRWESFNVLPDGKFQNSSFHGKCFAASTCSKFKHKLLQRWRLHNKQNFSHFCHLSYKVRTHIPGTEHYHAGLETRRVFGGSACTRLIHLTSWLMQPYCFWYVCCLYCFYQRQCSFGLCLFWPLFDKETKLNRSSSSSCPP